MDAPSGARPQHTLELDGESVPLASTFLNQYRSIPVALEGWARCGQGAAPDDTRGLHGSVAISSTIYPDPEPTSSA